MNRAFSLDYLFFWKKTQIYYNYKSSLELQKHFKHNKMKTRSLNNWMTLSPPEWVRDVMLSSLLYRSCPDHDSREVFVNVPLRTNASEPQSWLLNSWLVIKKPTPNKSHCHVCTMRKPNFGVSRRWHEYMKERCRIWGESKTERPTQIKRWHSSECHPCED